MQEFGAPNEVLIRVESQGAGDNAEQSALTRIRDVMDDDHIFRRQEVVGPTVSGELAQAGTLAVLAALIAIMAYIWLRFEWQFAIGAVLATAHDVILTIGMFALLQIEFTLASIAAILTIVGYSLNDTVVVYDRIRENLRKYKRMDIPLLLDKSINDTLSRTILTSLTTLIALIALYFLGTQVLAGFVFAMIFGVVVGTYSSIFIAAPLLILFKLRPGRDGSGGCLALQRQGSGSAGGDLSLAEADRDGAEEARAQALRDSIGLRLKEAHYPGRAPIDAYGDGGFRFADMSHRGAILCLPSGVYAWNVEDFEELTAADFARLEGEQGLDLLLFGTGVEPRPVARALREHLAGLAVRVEPMSTGAAVRTLNVLLAEDRAVGAALLAVE